MCDVKRPLIRYRLLDNRYQSSTGAVTITGKLTVNGKVQVNGAVTAAEINSNEGVELTLQALSITKGGVTKDSKEITLILTTTLKADKKGVITVAKKFKDNRTKEREFAVPELRLVRDGSIVSLKCSSGKLIVA